MLSDKKIFVTRPFMPPLEEFTPYLEAIWENKWLTNAGPFHQDFEKKLANYLGVEHLAPFANGTLALVTALQSLRITGEVITTPFSFVATAHSLLWNGIKPVFVDIHPETFNLDPEKIEAAITPQTTAILPVHVYGHPCNVERIQKIADTYGLKVIYDAAHAFGVNYKGRSLLKHGDLSILSFHATKVFNTFEGGAIICPDEKTKNRINDLKNFGYAGEVTVVATGINAKMNEIQAAFGLLQLKYVDKAIEMRKQIDAQYRTQLSTVPGITCPPLPADTTYNYSYFPILIGKEYPLLRDGLNDKLRQQGIYARRYFYPLISEFPMYRSLPSAAQSNLPFAKKAADQVLCLPIYPELDKESVKRIIAAIKDTRL
jgi:dTDP-4-amino-4,6-dideoxygalactose transaminase